MTTLYPLFRLGLPATRIWIVLPPAVAVRCVLIEICQALAWHCPSMPAIAAASPVAVVSTVHVAGRTESNLTCALRMPAEMVVFQEMVVAISQARFWSKASELWFPLTETLILTFSPPAVISASVVANT